MGAWGGGGTAWGGLPVSSPPSIPLWMGGLGSETSRVGWMCRSRLRFRDPCGMWGGRRGPGGSALCPPPRRGSCHQVWDSSLSGGPVASGPHAGPGPDPGQEEVIRIWGEKGRGGIRGEIGVWDIVPTAWPHVGTRSHGHRQPPAAHPGGQGPAGVTLSGSHMAIALVSPPQNVRDQLGSGWEAPTG